MTQRNVKYLPAVYYDRRSRHVIVKDLDDPKCTIGASLQGLVIVVHWVDGFTPEEVTQALRPWWPVATEIRYD